MGSRHQGPLAALCSLVLAGGCHSPGQHDFTSTRSASIADPSEEADRLWAAIQETLRRNRFELDRVDRRSGIITTLPEGSQHVFEFWRRDVATSYDFWEATINPIRRWVEVTVALDADRQWENVSAVVHKERLSSPDRQFNRSGAAMQFFGDNLPSTTGLVRVADTHDRWLDLGRDSALEDRLLAEMFRHAHLTTPHD